MVYEIFQLSAFQDCAPQS